MDRRPKLIMRQPRRLGDIIINLPIAKWMVDRGSHIIWPVDDEYRPLFEYVDYVEPVEKQWQTGEVLPSLNLGLNFEHCHAETKKFYGEQKDSFDVWRYKQAGVPFSEKHNLVLTPPPHGRQIELFDHLGLMGQQYVVMHENGSAGRNHAFNLTTLLKIVAIGPTPGFCLFDWIMVIANAQEGWFVDSSVANLVEGLNLLTGRRHFRPWWGHYGANFLLTTPVMSPDWDVIQA